MVIDHHTADIWDIPELAIVQAKASLHIAYGHTSHGGQLISGLARPGPAGDGVHQVVWQGVDDGGQAVGTRLLPGRRASRLMR